MSYRDDDDALRLYREDLERELANLDTRVSDLTRAEEERRRVAGELARVRLEMEGRAARRAPVRLDELRVASPCREPWDRMKGDEVVRHCGRCDQLVFNLSEMTTEEAEALVASRTGSERFCIRMFRRADGKVMTANCPDRGRQRRVALAVAAGVLAAGAGAAAFAQSLMDRRDRLTEASGPTLPQRTMVSVPDVPIVAPEPPGEAIQGGMPAPHHEMVGEMVAPPPPHAKKTHRHG